MKPRPTLTTERLVLRPFHLDDAQDLQRLAGAREVALNTLRIPHPYPDGAAEEWILKHQTAFEEDRDVTFAITLRDTGELAGCIGLVLEREHDCAEIGYWIGVPYWGRGYATEAVAAMLRYGFEVCALNRIYAAYFTRNPGSGRVMEKNGMRYEGTHRQDHKKWGEYVDTAMYAILREEWNPNDER